MPGHCPHLRVTESLCGWGTFVFLFYTGKLCVSGTLDDFSIKAHLEKSKTRCRTQVFRSNLKLAWFQPLGSLPVSPRLLLPVAHATCLSPAPQGGPEPNPAAQETCSWFVSISLMKPAAPATEV